jgi:hypothetical protein
MNLLHKTEELSRFENELFLLIIEYSPSFLLWFACKRSIITFPTAYERLQKEN